MCLLEALSFEHMLLQTPCFLAKVCLLDQRLMPMLVPIIVDQPYNFQYKQFSLFCYSFVLITDVRVGYHEETMRAFVIQIKQMPS